MHKLPMILTNPRLHTHLIRFHPHMSKELLQKYKKKFRRCNMAIAINNIKRVLRKLKEFWEPGFDLLYASNTPPANKMLRQLYIGAKLEEKSKLRKNILGLIRARKDNVVWQ